jgi:hypothetical protein
MKRTLVSYPNPIDRGETRFWYYLEGEKPKPNRWPFVIAIVGLLIPIAAFGFSILSNSTL